MSILKGPADADHYRIKVGRYGDRFYTDPLPACAIAPESEWFGPSISGVKKAAGSDWSYVAMKRGAKGLANDPTGIAGMDADHIYSALKGYNDDGLRRDGDRGTIIHLWAEDMLHGLAPDLNETSLMFRMIGGRSAPNAYSDALGYLDSLRSFFDTYQPELIATEIVCIHRTLNGVGYGGTADALVRINNKVYKLDWKSRGSDHAAYPEEGAQVSALAGAEYAIALVGGEPARIKVPECEAGLIVSIKTDGFRAYPVDLAKGFEHWTAMHAWWCARRHEKDAIKRAWAPKAAPAPTAPVVIEQPADPFDGIAAPEPKATPGRIAEVLHLWNAVQTEGKRDEAIRDWPPAIPGPKRAGEWTDANVSALLVVLRKLLPFGVYEDLPSVATPPLPDEPEFDVDPPKLDLGATLTPAEVGALRRRFEALTSEERAWIGGITTEARKAGTPIGVSVLPCERNFELARALVTLAHSEAPLAADDEGALRPLAALTMGTDDPLMPSIPLGAVLGAMSVDEARRFALHVDAYLAGGLAATVDDDGTMHFVPAVAA